MLFIITFILLLVAALPFVVPLLYLPAKAVKINRDKIGTVMVYEFSEDGITVEAKHPLVSSQEEMSYPYIKKVRETKDAFYLFIDMRQSCIVDKAGLSEGGVEELRELLKRKLPKKVYNGK